jgi:hypothetical protein
MQIDFLNTIVIVLHETWISRRFGDTKYQGFYYFSWLLTIRNMNIVI